MRAREVLPIPHFTPLPNSGAIYLGVFHLRGDIYPLIDVSPVLGLPAKRLTPDDMVILLDDGEDFAVGLVIDRIHGVLSYEPRALTMPRGDLDQRLEIFVRGVVQHQGRPVYLLDIDTLFRTRQLQAHF